MQEQLGPPGEGTRRRDVSSRPAEQGAAVDGLRPRLSADIVPYGKGGKKCYLNWTNR
jgi:hypothetical protein